MPKRDHLIRNRRISFEGDTIKRGTKSLTRGKVDKHTTVTRSIGLRLGNAGSLSSLRSFIDNEKVKGGLPLTSLWVSAGGITEKTLLENIVSEVVRSNVPTKKLSIGLTTLAKIKDHPDIDRVDLIEVYPRPDEAEAQISNPDLVRFYPKMYFCVNGVLPGQEQQVFDMIVRIRDMGVRCVNMRPRSTADQSECETVWQGIAEAMAGHIKNGGNLQYKMCDDLMCIVYRMYAKTVINPLADESDLDARYASRRGVGKAAAWLLSEVVNYLPSLVKLRNNKVEKLLTHESRKSLP